MRREIVVHFIPFILLFGLAILLKGMSAQPAIFFALGGILGTLLPEIDHLIYAFFLSPQDLTSQRIRYVCSKHEWGNCIRLAMDTKEERTGLIFHTLLFEIIFTILSFLVVSSSANYFGKGLVLAFLIHMQVDFLYHVRSNAAARWLYNFPLTINLDQGRMKVVWLVFSLITIYFLYIV